MRARVLMFGWEFPPHNSGGLGVACYGLTRAMAELGFDLTFVMPKKLNVGAPWARFLFADSLFPAFNKKIQAIAVNSPVTPYVTSESYAISSAFSRKNRNVPIYGKDLMSEVLRYAQLGAMIAEEEEHDIIYAHDWLSFGAGILAKRISGKPLIVHVHATEFDRCGGPNVNPGIYAIEKEGMETADAVIAVSEFTRQIIIREYGIPAWKVHVVHNGIDDTTVPAGASEYSRMNALKNAGYKIVLFLGRITLQKGPDYFIRTAKRVIERSPKVIFVMSGSGDMERSAMDLAAELGISDRVLFTGFLQGAERHEMYRSADLFIMPSVSEPFGLSPLEAMKLGTPVLVSKQSGISEAVKHALKADFWDIDEMANQILGIVGYPGLSVTLSSNGRQEADRLTWRKAADKVDNIVQEVMMAGVQ